MFHPTPPCRFTEPLLGRFLSAGKIFLLPVELSTSDGLLSHTDVSGCYLTWPYELCSATRMFEMGSALGRRVLLTRTMLGLAVHRPPWCETEVTWTIQQCGEVDLRVRVLPYLR